MEGRSPSRRKTLRRREIPLGIRFVTCSCLDRKPLFEHDRIKAEFVRTLQRTREHHRFALLAWVIMPEHVHLLMIPRLPESPVAAILNMLKSTFSRTVLARIRSDRDPALASMISRTGTLSFWQSGGGHDRNLRDEAKLTEAIRYIHQNPVERGLVANPVEWTWSSARWYAGDRTGGLPIDDARAFRVSESARLVAEFGSLMEVERLVRRGENADDDHWPAQGG
jgi:putative transposase